MSPFIKIKNICTIFVRQASSIINQMLKKSAFKILLKFNKTFLPSVSKLNVYKMSKMDKALVGYKYWVLLNALD